MLEHLSTGRRLVPFSWHSFVSSFHSQFFFLSHFLFFFSMGLFPWLMLEHLSTGSRRLVLASTPCSCFASDTVWLAVCTDVLLGETSAFALHVDAMMSATKRAQRA